MAVGNIKHYQNIGMAGSRIHKVASGTAASIASGDIVTKALGNAFVVLPADNIPTVASDYVVGIAASASTETAAAAGYVEVVDDRPGMVYAISPTTAASWDTQSEYDALVGDRVRLAKTSGVWTINGTDASGNGCVIELLRDINTLPGKVLFSIRMAASYLA